jgi:hypothetical protein
LPGGGERVNPPIFVTDLDRCLPSSAVSRNGMPGRWRTIDYETADFRGFMLMAGVETAAPAVRYPLRIRGWHDIFVGMFNTAWRPYSEQRLWAKLTDDPAFSLLFLRKPGADTTSVVQDVFWKTADLTNQEIVFEQVCTEKRASGCGRVVCDAVWIAYIKLVPLTREEVAQTQADRRRVDTKCLFATQDWGASMVTDASAGSVRRLIESYRNTDFQRLYWEGAVGDLCVYFTQIGRMWTPEHIRAEEFPIMEYRRVVENWTRYQQTGLDPFRVAVEYAHQVGLEFHAAYRFCEGMGPFHFSPPFDEVNKGSFYERHPELRAIRRDGSAAPRLSFSYPETRRFVLSILLEMAAYPVDGIAILFHRRPPFVEYEPPLVDGFRARFGEDPRQLEEKNPRWLTYRCSVLTDFLRELRSELGVVSERQGRSRRPAVTAWVCGTEEENLVYGMDVRTWVREGLIDTVVPYTSAKELFSGEPAWENEANVAYWLALTRGSACELALNIMPRALTPEQYCRKAHRLYEAGVKYLAFWDSAKVWSIDKVDGGALPSLVRLGHQDDLRRWVQAGEPMIGLPTTRLRKVGDWEMTFIAE